MKRPPDLTQLLEDLDLEIDDSSVETENGSSAAIRMDYGGEDKNSIILTEKECKLVFHSKSTVRQLHDALGSPAEATVTLHNLVLEDDVIVALERIFTAVDEA